MNNDQVERIQYLDTQVIPGAKYTYKFYTINFVIGSKYMYASEDASDGIEWVGFRNSKRKCNHIVFI